MKKLFVFIGAIMLLLFASIFFLEIWVQTKFENTLNTNPNRKYDLNYDNLSVSVLKGRIELNQVKITPLTGDSIPTIIEGKVVRANLEGIGIFNFLRSKEITIENLHFLNPEFTLTRTNFQREQVESSKPFQSLFRDIISRGEIKNFSLSEGKAILFDLTDSLKKIGSFEGLEIIARGIETDYVQLDKAIPFKLEELKISFRNLAYQVSENQTFNFESYGFDFSKGQMNLKNIHLELDKEWYEHAKNQPVQKEIMEFEIGKITVRGLSEASQFGDSLIVIAESITLDSLDFKIGKDKNRPFPPKELKQDFSFLLEALTFPMKVDSLLVTNSTITYSEIGNGQKLPGTIELSKINGMILNVSTIEKIERENSLFVQVNAVFDRSGQLSLEVHENYFEREWEADITLENLEMTHLNQTVNNLAGISIASGRLNKLHLNMEANAQFSDNHFLMEYEDLKIELLNAEHHKKGFLSSMANLAVHKQNKPEDKKYQELAYATKRDPYKGPINLIWLSAKDGLMATIPSKSARKLMKHSNNENRGKKHGKKKKTTSKE
ncbi:DUF748 domain-containing protein [Algoriphagus sp. SE2]|uniref:DUF748 domain-containing protein n=1 Tax=Algoriphagus sp. SE2 TaxID=3141536 RepID=UPI0031CCE1EB